MDKNLSAERAPDFKTGLGNGEAAVQRHVDRQDSIRKKKKEERMSRVRKQKPLEGTTIAVTLNELLAAYSLDAMCKGSYDAVRALDQICRFSNEEALDQMIPQLLFAGGPENPVGVAALVAMVKAVNEFTNHASTILVNITGTANRCSLLIAKAIIDNGFLTHAVEHIKQSSQWVPDIWCIIANLSCLCEDARNAVVAVPQLFPQAFVHQWTLGKMSYAPLLLLMCGIIEAGPVLPALNLVEKFWSLMLQHLQSERCREGLGYSIGLMAAIAVRLRNDQEYFCKLLAMDNCVIIKIAVELAPGVEDFNQQKLGRFLVEISSLPTESFQIFAMRAGAIKVARLFIESANEKLRREGLLWVGNVAASSFGCTEMIYESGIVDYVLTLMRGRDKHYLMRNAVYVLMAMCNASLRHPNKTRSQDIMGPLFRDRGVISMTVDFSDEVGCDDLSIDVLNLWLSALQWDFGLIAPLLEQYGGFDKVDRLCAHRNDKVNQVADKVAELIHRRTSNMDVVDDVTEFNPPALIPFGCNEMVVQGAFKF